MKAKIKRNDTVKVIAGKEKGRTGKVRKVMPEKGQVLVEGINMRTKHVKATSEGPGRKFKKKLRFISLMLRTGIQKHKRLS